MRVLAMLSIVIGVAIENTEGSEIEEVSILCKDICVPLSPMQGWQVMNAAAYIIITIVHIGCASTVLF